MIRILILFCSLSFTETNTLDPHVLALRLRTTDENFYYTSKGQISLEYGMQAQLHVIGLEIHEGTHIKLVTDKREFGDDCDHRNLSRPVLETAEMVIKDKGTLELNSKDIVYSSSCSIYYVCLLVNGLFIHQGTGNEVTIQLRSSTPVPLWGSLLGLVILLSCSALLSGLKTSMLSLEQSEFQVLIETGSETEKSNAAVILPVRKYGNFLYCSLIMSKILVNILIPIVLINIQGSNIAITTVCSTMLILVFGEIIPQADCSINGLTAAAKTIWITKFLMVLTSPLSWPISKILDMLLEREVASIYSRYRIFDLLGVMKTEMDMSTQETEDNSDVDLSRISK